MVDEVRWTLAGRYPLAGVKTGLRKVVAFFDSMGGIMRGSKPAVGKLIVAENKGYVVECSPIRTNAGRRDQYRPLHLCRLTIRNGKITEGRHFFADPKGADNILTG